MTEWHETINEADWPDDQKLPWSQADLIGGFAATLKVDMNVVAADFTDYWQHVWPKLAPSKRRTFVLPLRLRTWIRNEARRRPVSQLQSDDRSDARIERILAMQTERGNR